MFATFPEGAAGSPEPHGPVVIANAGGKGEGTHETNAFSASRCPRLKPHCSVSRNAAVTRDLCSAVPRAAAKSFAGETDRKHASGRIFLLPSALTLLRASCTWRLTINGVCPFTLSPAEIERFLRNGLRINSIHDVFRMNIQAFLSNFVAHTSCQDDLFSHRGNQFHGDRVSLWFEIIVGCIDELCIDNIADVLTKEYSLLGNGPRPLPISPFPWNTNSPLTHLKL